MDSRRQPHVKFARTLLLAAATSGLIAGAPALAQPTQPAPPQEAEVEFAADQLDYDHEADVVTAAGDVRMTRDGNRIRADRIIWNRKTGEVRAEGNVIVQGQEGDLAYGDSVELKDTLRDGVVDNLLIVLNDGGRLAATRGTRKDGVSTLERAVYSPCRVIDDNGCPKEPIWKITAVRVTHNPVTNRISYKNARLEFLGVPVLALPALSHPADDRGGTGFLIPNLQYTKNNGLEVAVPFYVLFGPNRDLTITPHLFSDVAPLLQADYRHLTQKGAYQFSTYGTYGKRLSATDPTLPAFQDFRGYFEGSGRFQLDRHWSLSGSARIASAAVWSMVRPPLRRSVQSR